MNSIKLPNREDLEHPDVFKKLIEAHRHLAELKGMACILPNAKILLMNLTLQEAKDSSSIENIITTQDSLYKHQIKQDVKGHNKEIHNYSEALITGHEMVQSQNGISINTILKIQSLIEPNRPGLRKVPGTVLKDDLTGKVVYTPPSPDKIPALMSQLEKYINNNSEDPLVKMAIIHHHFESIHPFYDGNGRTGRIINILYLLLNNLLESPILYLSRYILQHRSAYYKLLQQVREEGSWIDWITFMLQAISTISQETKELIINIDKLFRKYKIIIRDNHKFYSHDLINTIFTHPYTKAEFLKKEMKISKATAIRYLDALAQSTILEKNKLGKETYYINKKLFDLLKNS